MTLPFMTNGKRDYKREDKLYNDKPQIIRNREARNQARRIEEAKGLVHKGDNLQVDHTVPLNKGGSTGKGNLRVVPASQNESFSRNKDGSLKSQYSSKERSAARK